MIVVGGGIKSDTVKLFTGAGLVQVGKSCFIVGQQIVDTGVAGAILFVVVVKDVGIIVSVIMILDIFVDSTMYCTGTIILTVNVVQLVDQVLHASMHVFAAVIGDHNVCVCDNVGQGLSIKTNRCVRVVVFRQLGSCSSKAAILVNIGVLGTVCQRHIIDDGVTSLRNQSDLPLDIAVFITGIGNAIFNVVGNLHILLDLIVTDPAFFVLIPVLAFLGGKPFVNYIFAILLNDLMDLAQLNGLVALGVLFDVEGDLEMAALRVIGTAVIGVILFGGLFGLFLRGLLRAGTFLALFLRVAGVSIAGVGGLLAGIALIFGVVLVLALDVVLVVLGGAGQGLYRVGLLRALNGGFIVRRGIVTVALAVGGLVGVVTGGSDRLFFGRGVIRRGVVVRIAVGQRDNGHLQAGVIRVGQGFGCGGTAHANRAAEHRKGQRHRNDLLLLGLFSHNRHPHFTRDCVPRATFQKLQHKIDARWAVLIILYYIRFPKISRG